MVRDLNKRKVHKLHFKDRIIEKNRIIVTGHKSWVNPTDSEGNRIRILCPFSDRTKKQRVFLV